MTKPSKRELLEIEGTDLRYVTRSQLSRLTSEHLSRLTSEQLSRLTSEQLSWLTSEQLSWLTSEQLSWLTSEQLSRLTSEQLSRLTSEQLSGLTSEQLEIVKLNNIPVLENPYTKLLEAIKSGGLEMRSWHSCETVHCVGGWTVQLTNGGKELEAKYGTRLAAELILRASRPDAPLPNFTASNEAAMVFIEVRASEENE